MDLGFLESGSDIMCKDGGGGGGVEFYLIFIPPPTRFGGYSDQPAWRPSVCPWKKLVRSITLIPFEIF